MYGIGFDVGFSPKGRRGGLSTQDGGPSSGAPTARNNVVPDAMRVFPLSGGNFYWFVMFVRPVSTS